MKAIFISFLLVMSFVQTAWSEEAKLPTKKVSIQAKNAQARGILEFLLEDAKLSYEIPEDFEKTKKLTMSVHNAPWDQVFKSALDSVGYTYTFDGKVLRLIKK